MKRVAYKLLGLIGLGTLALAGASASAQGPLDLDASESYAHPHSDIVLPATLAGLERESGTAYHPKFLDVAVQYMPDDNEALSVYIYRNTNGAVPVWFAQAQWAIENRDIYGDVKPAFAPTAFTPPRQQNASGMIVVYATEGTFKSTGLALIPVNGWYVKLRASSNKRETDELYQWMLAAIAEIQWPEAISAASASIPVADCETSLDTDGRARIVATDETDRMMDSILGGVLSSIAQNKKDEGEIEPQDQPTYWCRDEARFSGNISVYRPDDDSARYLLASGDNGYGVIVGPDAGASLSALLGDDKDARPSWSISFQHPDKTLSFAARDRLPAPRQLVRILQNEQPVSSASTWGEDSTITIGSGKSGD